MSDLENKVGLELFHGRTDPEAAMDGWGMQGPVFIVEFVHTTYAKAGDVKLGDAHDIGPMRELRVVGDCLYYDGVYYGDWSVFHATLIEREPELKNRLKEFDRSKATPPKQEKS